MPSKLTKVQKQVTKKKGNKINSLHENSRDALRLRKASVRDDRVARLGAIKQKTNLKWIDRIDFIKSHLPDTLHPLTTEEIQEIIQKYLDRCNQEIAQLKAERRSGRPASTRQIHLEQQIDQDKKEYESGFWAPNLSDEETLVRLNNWQGDWSNLDTLRYLRIDSSARVKESQFPPRGAS